MKELQYQLRLAAIEYTGDNIGSDLVFKLKIRGYGKKDIEFKSKIAHNTRGTFKDYVLNERRINQPFTQSVFAEVLEDDFYDDKGSGGNQVKVSFAPGKQGFRVKVKVVGDPIGDAGKTANITLDFEIIKTELIDKIAAKHRVVFQRLQKFIDAGNKVYYLYGNHDDALLNPLIRTHVNKATGVKFLFGTRGNAKEYINSGFKVYAEHGHRFDKANFTEDPFDFKKRPLGRWVVENFVTELELIAGNDCKGPFANIDSFSPLSDYAAYVKCLSDVGKVDLDQYGDLAGSFGPTQKEAFCDCLHVLFQKGADQAIQRAQQIHFEIG